MTVGRGIVLLLASVPSAMGFHAPVAALCSPGIARSSIKGGVLRPATLHMRRPPTTTHKGLRMSGGGDSGKVELWGSRGSRSPLVDWYLHELGVEWEAPSTGNPNPFGKIPCLRDGEEVVFESGAILLYLAGKYGKLGSSKEMADAFKWVTWANASLDPICFVETPTGQVRPRGEVEALGEGGRVGKSKWRTDRRGDKRGRELGRLVAILGG
jgi:hypothetical protein